jgi:hypothetical protein
MLDHGNRKMEVNVYICLPVFPPGQSIPVNADASEGAPRFQKYAVLKNYLQIEDIKNYVEQAFRMKHRTDSKWTPRLLERMYLYTQ